ncbi:MAG: cytochrome C [Deltaproteobacteria bacterium RBG_16_47_11]|nr:MAG: cytochrome C [Deltaproteobacteria bacterium RBG_16_47_11]
MKKIFFAATLMITLAFNSISWSEEITYRKHIKPLFDAKCAGCHGAGSPEHPEFKENQKKYVDMLKGPKMDSYAHLISFVGWPDTGAVMRRLDDGKNTKDGKPGNMYQYIGATEEERQKNLKLFKEWVGNWTLKRWHEIKKEELDAIKVRY